MKTRWFVVAVALAIVPTLFPSVASEDKEQLLTIDHYVRAKSTVPSMTGQTAQLYVQERALPGTLARSADLSDRVVLFVHGAGTPAEVSFDVPFQDYSWMAYLANAGYVVFSVDMTGYGRSARPKQMDDKCNLSPEQQKSFGVNCPATYPGNLTNIESDWNDISATVA